MEKYIEKFVENNFNSLLEIKISERINNYIDNNLTSKIDEKIRRCVEEIFQNGLKNNADAPNKSEDNKVEEELMSEATKINSQMAELERKLTCKDCGKDCGYYTECVNHTMKKFHPNLKPSVNKSAEDIVNKYMATGEIERNWPDQSIARTELKRMKDMKIGFTDSTVANDVYTEEELQKVLQGKFYPENKVRDPEDLRDERRRQEESIRNITKFSNSEVANASDREISDEQIVLAMDTGLFPKNNLDDTLYKKQREQLYNEFAKNYRENTLSPDNNTENDFLHNLDKGSDSQSEEILEIASRYFMEEVISYKTVPEYMMFDTSDDTYIVKTTDFNDVLKLPSSNMKLLRYKTEKYFKTYVRYMEKLPSGFTFTDFNGRKRTITGQVYANVLAVELSEEDILRKGLIAKCSKFLKKDIIDAEVSGPLIKYKLPNGVSLFTTTEEATKILQTEEIESDDNSDDNSDGCFEIKSND